MADVLETVVIQVLQDGVWRSYSRCSEQEARSFMAHADRGRFRAVDWIFTERVLPF